MDVQANKIEAATAPAFRQLRTAMLLRDKEAVASISYGLLGAGHDFGSILQQAILAVDKPAATLQAHEVTTDTKKKRLPFRKRGRVILAFASVVASVAIGSGIYFNDGLKQQLIEACALVSKLDRLGRLMFGSPATFEASSEPKINRPNNDEETPHFPSDTKAINYTSFSGSVTQKISGPADEGTLPARKQPEIADTSGWTKSNAPPPMNKMPELSDSVTQTATVNSDLLAVNAIASSNRRNDPPALTSTETSSGGAPSLNGASEMRGGLRSANDDKPYIARGDELLIRGDIASARLFYQWAAERGNPIAAVRLGGTYDPKILIRAGITRFPGNPAIAEFWYKRAGDLGRVNVQALPKELSDNK